MTLKWGKMLDEQRRQFLMKNYENGFVGFCGYRALQADDGKFEAELIIRPQHLQQDGIVHAGVLATMADHTGGYAAFTVVEEDISILTVEFKINLLKPAAGERLICRSQVISQGRRIVVSESEISSVNQGIEKRVAKAMVTMVPVPRTNLS